MIIAVEKEKKVYSVNRLKWCIYIYVRGSIREIDKREENLCTGRGYNFAAALITNPRQNNLGVCHY